MGGAGARDCRYFPLIPQLLVPGGQLPLPTKYRLFFGEPMHFEGDPNDDARVAEQCLPRATKRSRTCSGAGSCSERACSFERCAATRRLGAGEGAVVVTGSCGRLGKRLVRRLHRVRRVIGIDRKPFLDRPSDVDHHELDIRSKKVRDVFRQGVGALVHLGVMHFPRGDFAEHHAWNVIGLKTLLEHVVEFGVKKVVLLSSANVYGPRPDNPQFLSEEAPLLGAGPSAKSAISSSSTWSASRSSGRNPAIETVILRPAHILGTVNNAPSNYLRLPVVPTLLGFDPMVQVVHQDDVVTALLLALAPETRGIFNVAGPPPLSLSRALSLLGRRTLPVPHGLARLGFDRLFKLGVSSFPGPELDFIRYVCMVDDSRARNELGYAPAHDIELDSPCRGRGTMGQLVARADAPWSFLALGWRAWLARRVRRIRLRPKRAPSSPRPHRVRSERWRAEPTQRHRPCSFRASPVKSPRACRSPSSRRTRDSKRPTPRSETTSFHYESSTNRDAARALFRLRVLGEEPSARHAAARIRKADARAMAPAGSRCGNGR